MFRSEAKVERFLSTPCNGSNGSGPMIRKAHGVQASFVRLEPTANGGETTKKIDGKRKNNPADPPAGAPQQIAATAQERSILPRRLMLAWCDPEICVSTHDVMNHSPKGQAKKMGMALPKKHPSVFKPSQVAQTHTQLQRRMTSDTPLCCGSPPKSATDQIAGIQQQLYHYLPL